MSWRARDKRGSSVVVERLRGANLLWGGVEFLVAYRKGGMSQLDNLHVLELLGDDRLDDWHSVFVG